MLRKLPPEPLLELPAPYQLEEDDRAALKRLQSAGSYSFVDRLGWSQFTQIIELPFDQKLKRSIWFDYWLPSKPSIEGNLKDLLRIVKGSPRPDHIKIKGQKIETYSKDAWSWEKVLERHYPNMIPTASATEYMDREIRSRSKFLTYI